MYHWRINSRMHASFSLWEKTSDKKLHDHIMLDIKQKAARDSAYTQSRLLIRYWSMRKSRSTLTQGPSHLRFFPRIPIQGAIIDCHGCYYAVTVLYQKHYRNLPTLC